MMRKNVLDNGKRVLIDLNNLPDEHEHEPLSENVLDNGNRALIDLNNLPDEHEHEPLSENVNCMTPPSGTTGGKTEIETFVLDIDLNLTPAEKIDEEEDTSPQITENNGSSTGESLVQVEQHVSLGHPRVPSYVEKGKMVENKDSRSLTLRGEEVRSLMHTSSQPVKYSYTRRALFTPTEVVERRTNVGKEQSEQSGIEASESEKEVVEILANMKDEKHLTGQTTNARAIVLANEAVARATRQSNEGGSSAVAVRLGSGSRQNPHSDMPNKRPRSLELFPEADRNADTVNAGRRPAEPGNVGRIQNRPPTGPGNVGRIRNRRPTGPTSLRLKRHRQLESALFAHLDKNSPFAPK